MIALPESFINYDHDYLLKKMVDEFKKRYGVECFAALHHNKRQTNLHIHMIFAERKRLDQPMGVTGAGTDEEIAEAGIRAMEDFYHEIGMPVNMKELGIAPTDGQIKEMAAGCMAASGGHMGSARKLSQEDMVRIYKNAR